MKYIFVHIPKCAGSSMYSQYYTTYGHGLRKKTFKYFKDSSERKTPHFSFTFSRNPWDRLVSAYNYLSRGGSSSKDLKDYRRLFYTHKNFKTAVLNWHESYFDQIHFKPQWEWICDDNKNVIVDFVGRFENLQHDFNTVCDKIGVPRKKLPHKNKTNHKHYTEYYDEETREIVAQKYAKDIEYFGYEFGE